MLVYVSDHLRGKVDIVPGCCYVATEFVCAWFLPILPRRSLLVFADLDGPAAVAGGRYQHPGRWLLFFASPEAAGGSSAIPVRLSLKSILFAYLRPLLTFWAVVAASFPIVMYANSLGPKPGQQFGFLLFSAAFLGVPCLVLLLMQWASVPPLRRRTRLAETKGLPPHIVARLRKAFQVSSFGGVWDQELDQEIPAIRRNA